MANTKGDRHSSAAPEPKGETITAVGIVSDRSGKGLVDLRWAEKHGLLDAHEMSNHVQMLLREAWYADSDAALVSFLQRVLDFDKERAFIFLADFRRHRYAQLESAAFDAARSARAHYEAETKDELRRRGEKGGGK